MQNMSIDCLVSLTNVSLKIDQKQILDNISLSIKDNEIVTIVGPNGAGKSSLLSVILGILPTSSGQIILKKKLKIGYVPQFINRDKTLPMTVTEFISLTPAKGKSKQEIDNLFKLLRIDGLTQQFLFNLSGGELRRVLLARALLNSPQLLILDEPTAGIDVNGQTLFYSMLNELKQSYHFAVLMVSHDLHLVMSTTNRVICLNQHICCEGIPKQVIENPAYQALFGKKNDALAFYQHHHNHTHDCGHDTNAR